MELKDIYNISDALIEKVKQGEIPKKVLKNITISVNVSPSILYGIDKEFYRLTHDGDMDDFKHSDTIEANINGINFKINKKL